VCALPFCYECDINFKLVITAANLNLDCLDMVHYPSFKKFFSVIAFVFLLGCPCMACEEIHAVHEFLHQGERKRFSINGLRQYLKKAFSKLLRTVISEKILLLQNIFKFATLSLPTIHYNPHQVSVSSTILLL
jgi:hypothetical protein